MLHEEINVVLGFDDAYAQHACVTLMSLFDSNPTLNFHAYLLVPDTFRSATRFKQSLHQYEHELSFVSVDMSRLGSCRIHSAPWRIASQITNAAYLRLLMTELLTDRVHRLIYLDSDVVVRDDILPLWQAELGGRVLGAVPCRFAAAHQEWFRQRLEMDAHAVYFNSGVLLVNLVQWRLQDIGGRALDFLMLKPERITHADQCALNHVLNGNYLVLDAQWNFQDAMLREQSHKTAVIIHFNGDRKPWHYMCAHPERARYLKYLQQTQWKNYKFPDRSLMNLGKRALRDRAPWIVDLRRKVWRRPQEIPPWERG